MKKKPLIMGVIIFGIIIISLFLLFQNHYQEREFHELIEIELGNNSATFGNQMIKIDNMKFINATILIGGDCQGLIYPAEALMGFVNFTLEIEQIETRNNTVHCDIALVEKDFSSKKVINSQKIERGFSIDESQKEGWVNLGLNIPACKNELAIKCDEWKNTMTLTLS
jgi:hypothetical protein